MTVNQILAVGGRRTRTSWLAWTTVAITGIMLLAFGLRAYSVRWQLPFNDHPDEPNIVNYVVRALRTGDLNPHAFRKPHFYIYVLLPVLWLHYHLGLANGSYVPLDRMFVTTYQYTTIPGFFVWGRMVTVLIGSVTTLLVYQLGKRVWNTWAGLLGALFIATSPFLLRHSQIVTTDIPNAFMVTATFMAAYALMQTGRWRAYLLAGLLSGLTASTKYNGGAVVTAIVAAHVLYWARGSLRQFLRLMSAGLASVCGFILGSPYAILAWGEFRAGLFGQINNYNPSPDDVAGNAWDVHQYGKWFWETGLRPGGVIAMCLGIALLLRYRRKTGILWLSFAIPYLLVHLSQQVTFMRNLTPLITLSALPIGVAGAAAIEWVQRRRPRLGWAAAAGILLALFAAPLWAAVEETRYEARPYSAALALDFVRSLPRGQRIAVERIAGIAQGNPFVEQIQRVTQHPATWYRANNYRYVVVNVAKHRGDSKAAYLNLRSEASISRYFPGDSAGQPGPPIEVLDFGIHPEALAIVRRPTDVGVDLRLLGYEMKPGVLRPASTPLEGADQRIFKPGDGLQLNLTWQALHTPPFDYSLFMHVLDAGGNTVAQRDAPIRQGDYQTSHWRPGEIVVDRADMPLPALPAGAYRVRVGVYRLETGERLPLTPGESDSGGTSMILTTFEVR